MVERKDTEGLTASSEITEYLAALTGYVAARLETRQQDVKDFRERFFFKKAGDMTLKPVQAQIPANVKKVVNGIVCNKNFI